MGTIVATADFQEYVRDRIGVTDLAILDRSLAAAESAVRRYCHRSFEMPAAQPSARVFAPMSGELLYVDDIAVLTSISNDGEAVATGYQLEPLNGIDITGAPVPTEAIRRTSGFWVVDGARATVTVTATWGWATMPSAVREAVMVLGKDIADRREMRGNVASFGDFGAVRMSSSPDAMGLLTNFRRWDRAGIA